MLQPGTHLNTRRRRGFTLIELILALAVFSLIVPNFTGAAPGPMFSAGQEIFLMVMCLGLYAVFLAVLAEYVGRIAVEVRRRPRYRVSAVLQAAPDSGPVFTDGARAAGPPDPAAVIAPCDEKPACIERMCVAAPTAIWRLPLIW